MKKTLLLALSILFISSCLIITASAEEKYPEIILNVPFYSQNYKNSGDCGISSVAMIEAYKKGYSQNDSTVYNAVFKHNNYKVALSSYAHIGYSRVSNSLEVVYEQLSHGNPVIIFRSSPHYSVVYGYNGATDKLEKEGFLVLNTFRVDGKTSVGPETSNNFGYSNMKDWLNGYEWQDTMVRTGNAIPLEDKSEGNGMFNEVWVSNYTETNAQINAKIPYQWITEAGFYIGTSKTNLTKHAEKLGTGNNVSEIWYDLNKWGVSLKKGTTYYYRFYFVKDGVTYKSNIYSFPKTNEKETVAPEKYNSIWVSNISEENAQINANIDLQYITEAGFYIGTSKTNLTKHSEKLGTGNNVSEIWYDLNKWGVTLKEGTTYYYQFYYIKSGTTYKSDIRTFKTTGCEHTPTIDYKGASCTTTGKIIRGCSRCGEILHESTIPATGHTFDNGIVTKNPTATSTGVKTYTCEICKTTKEEIIPAIEEEIHRHTVSAWTVDKQATCTEDGKRVQKCTECGEVVSTEIIAKGNHKFDNGVVITEATETKEGKKLYTCTVCEYAKVETIPLKTVTKSPFTDVPETEWYHTTIITVYENKLMMGNSLTTFNPTGTMTLAEAITIASRIHHKNDTGEDLNVLGGANWYDAYVNYAIEKGIIKKNDFSDYTKEATRGEMAYIFSRSVTKERLVEINKNVIVPDVYDDYKYANEIKLLYKAGVVAGSDEIGRYYPERNISRAEVAMIVARLTNLVNRVGI